MTARLMIAVAFCAACAGFALGQSPQPIEVIGERDTSGQFYTITVRNHSAASVRQIELPHFRVDLWSGPAGWETSGTNIQGRAGTRSESGLLTAVASDAAGMIGKGMEAKFELRVNRIGAPRGLGTARLSLADGSVVSVDGVVLPTAPSWFANYATMLLLAAILLAFIAFKITRSRKPQAAASPVE